MHFPLFVARKYFWSGKKKKFINIISIISMFLVMVGTAALIIVLSVFNGLEDLLRSLHNNFDAEIKISAARGKSFEISDELLSKITSTPGVEVVTEVIEDNAYVKYRDSEMVVTMKGVSDNFIDHHRMDNAIVDGDFTFRKDGVAFAVIGRGVQHILSVPIENDFFALQIYYPGKLRPGRIDPRKDLRQENIRPGAVFAIEKQYDEQYIFVPLDFAKKLLDYGERRTSLEIKTGNQFSTTDVQDELKKVLGNEFRVQNSEEQHATILRAVKIEKLFVFITFSVVLLIASVNIFFSLTMLAIDKKKDIAIFFSMGAKRPTIRNIFLLEGMIISLSGTILGILIGGLICWIQLNYGIVGMGIQNAVVANYPVKMQTSDFILTAASMFLITVLISYRPAYLASRSSILKHL